MNCIEHAACKRTRTADSVESRKINAFSAKSHSGKEKFQRKVAKPPGRDRNWEPAGPPFFPFFLLASWSLCVFASICSLESSLRIFYRRKAVINFPFLLSVFSGFIRGQNLLSVVPVLVAALPRRASVVLLAFRQSRRCRDQCCAFRPSLFLHRISLAVVELPKFPDLQSHHVSLIYRMRQADYIQLWI